MTVIQFPVKRELKLTEEHEKRIEEFVAEYLKLLNDICNEMDVANAKDEDVAVLTDLVAQKLIESFVIALEKEFEET